MQTSGDLARTQLGFLASLSRPVVPPPPSPPAVCGRAGSAGSAVRLRLSWPGYAAVPMQNPRFPGGWMAIGSFSADGRSGARALTGGSAESFIRAKGIPLHLAGKGHDMDHDRGLCWTDRHARQACLMRRGGGPLQIAQIAALSGRNSSRIRLQLDHREVCSRCSCQAEFEMRRRALDLTA